MKLSKALKFIREESGLSVREQAAEIGLTHTTYWRIERGKACDLPALAKLLTWLMGK